MGEHHNGPKHSLSGADPDSYFDLKLVPPGKQPKREDIYGYLAQYNQAYSGRWGSLALVSVICIVQVT